MNPLNADYHFDSVNCNVVTVKPKKIDWLAPCKVDSEGEVDTNPVTDVDIPFNHEFIVNELERFSLEPKLCAKCCPASRHFQDPNFLTDRVLTSNAKWIKMEKSVLFLDTEYRYFDTPLWDPCNIEIDHSPFRPQGYISLIRETNHVDDEGEFARIA